MFLISFRASQLEQLYQKLIVTANLPGKPFIHNPIFLTSSYGQELTQATIFSLELEPNQSFTLSLLPPVLTSTEPGLFIHLIYNTKGIEYQLDQQSTSKIKQGMLVMTETQPYSIHVDKPSHGFWLMIYLPCQWYNQSLSLKPVLSPRVIHLSSLIRVYSHEFSQLSNRITPLTILNQTTALYQLFSQVLVQLSEKNRQQTDVLVIAQAKQYLLKHLNQQLPPLQYLAKLSNMSLTTLKRKFVEAEKQSPQQFFIHQKMKMAAQQLEDKKSIKEIAQDLGYTHSTNFTNAFKRQYGVSPLKYRQGHQHNLDVS